MNSMLDTPAQQRNKQETPANETMLNQKKGFAFRGDCDYGMSACLCSGCCSCDPTADEQPKMNKWRFCPPPLFFYTKTELVPKLYALVTSQRVDSKFVASHFPKQRTKEVEGRPSFVWCCRQLDEKVGDTD